MLSWLLDRWFDELPEVAGSVGRVVSLAVQRGGELQLVEELDLDPEEGVVGDSRGPEVRVARRAILEALAGPGPERVLASGDQLYVELDLSRVNLPPAAALTIGTAILAVGAQTHAPDEVFRRAFGHRAARRIARHNRRGLGGRRLLCRVAQPGTVHVGDRVFAKGVGIRFQP